VVAAAGPGLALCTGLSNSNYRQKSTRELCSMACRCFGLPFLRGISSTEVAVGSAVGERFDAQGLQAGDEPSIQATNSGTAWRSPQRNRKL